jgi:hypothetical protein
MFNEAEKRLKSRGGHLSPESARILELGIVAAVAVAVVVALFLGWGVRIVAAVVAASFFMFGF